jgi:hypothetical protein
MIVAVYFCDLTARSSKKNRRSIKSFGFLVSIGVVAYGHQDFQEEFME